MSEPDLCVPCSMTLRVAAVIHVARTGELSLATTLLHTAQHVAARWPNHPWDAALSEARAALRLAQGQDAQSWALLREASDLHLQAGRLLAVERCQAG